MGCGESKHAVATENTISRKNSRAGLKREKSSEAIVETKKTDGKMSSSVQGEVSVSRRNSIAKSSNEETREVDSGRVTGGDDTGAGVDGKKIDESVELKNEDKIIGEERKEETVEEIKVVEDSIEDQKVVEDAKKETLKDQIAIEEKKEEIANGEAETVKKENLVQEIKSAETTEAEVSIPLEKQEEKSDVLPGVEILKKE